MVHGNIKPASIIAVSDELKLSSDGIRPIGESKESADTRDAYDAPENISGAISPSGDVWSLGMTLVEVLTNRLPTWDRTTANDPELPENIPQPFDDIAKHCLSWDPGRRWSTTEIRKRLDGATEAPRGDVEKRELSAVDEVRESPARRKGKLRGSRVAASVILALIVIAAGVQLLRHRSQTPQPASTTSAQRNAESLVQPATNDSLRASKTKAGSVNGGAVTHEVLPDVPQKARDTISGTVTVNVKVAVDTAGAVSHAALVSAGPSGYFANLAVQATRKWTFTAPTVDGKPMPSEWNLRFEFKRDGTRAVPRRLSPSL